MPTGSSTATAGRGRLAFVAAALALAAASCTSSTDTPAPNAGPAGSVDAPGTTVMMGSTADAGTVPGWSSYRHDAANTGFAAGEDKINATNVAKLTRSWSVDGVTGVTGTPAVADGIAYFGDWKGTVWAVKADTGEKVWTTPIEGGFIVASPALHDDAVFIADGHTLYRLDKATGAIRWKASTNEHPLSQINGSPVYVDGLVLQATAGIQDAVPDPNDTFRGTVGASDAESGKERWRFYATPADATAGSGVGIWSTPAVDQRRGLLFIGTGNTSSEPTAPLADALVALDYKTGEVRWARQFTPQDVFPKGNPTGKDVDVGASPNLWTSNGRDLVGVGDKGGNYHALDRETGEVVWQTSLTPGSVFGGVIGSGTFVDGRLVMSSNVGDPKTNAPTNVSKVFALDPATGEIQWTSDELPGKVFGPVTAVKGVAFVGTDANTMYAFDTATGKKLWSFDAAGKVGAGPAIVDGRLLWGYGFILFRGTSEGGVLSFTPGTAP
jgi:polyvinyl alcohol dehydrogenase (cytochrome)